MVKNEIAINQMSLALDPILYAKSIDLPFGTLYRWQEDVLSIRYGNVCINGARQSGKSTITSVLPCHKARFYPKSLSIVIAPTLPQANEDMAKIKAVIARDSQFPELVKNNDEEIRLINGSRIVVKPATDAARGMSAPSLVILDEASRIDDFVFSEVVMPMFTKSKRYLFIRISTPNGRKGFFYEDFRDSKVKRFEVRSPYDVCPTDNFRLIPAMPEEQYKQKMLSEGIIAYYSPQHQDYDKQQGFLERMGKLRYLQEFCCQFVEPEDNVFRYDDIERFKQSQAKPLSSNIQQAQSAGLKRPAIREAV